MSTLSWITWITLALVSSLTWLVGSRVIRIRWIPALFLAILVMTSIFCGLYLFCTYAKPTPVKVIIALPKSGDQVTEPYVVISGTVIPNNARVTLVVRSEKAIKWWIQNMAEVKTVEGVAGQWQTKVSLGTQEEGIGENFQIIAIASADNVLFNILTGRHFTVRQPCDNIPKWEQSEPIVLRRTK